MLLSQRNRWAIALPCAVMLLCCISCSGGDAPSSVRDDGPEEATPQQSAEEAAVDVMRAWILAHAPHLSLDVGSGEYAPIGERGETVTAGAACVPLRFLAHLFEHDAHDEALFYKILQLAEAAIALQHDEPGAFHDGAFETQEGSGYFYAIGAALCIEGLVHAHRATGRARFLAAAERAAAFLRRLQEEGVEGAPCEYYRDVDPPLFKCTLHTKMLLAVEPLAMLAEATGDARYREWAEELHASLLVEGLAGGYEYFSPRDAGGDDRWHRLGGADCEEECFVYADSMSAALASLFAYEGASPIVREAYAFYNDLDGGAAAPDYDPAISWAGYLRPADGTTAQGAGQPYYDVVNAGILMELRRAIDPAAFARSRAAIVAHPEIFLHWGLDLALVPINARQNARAIALIGDALLLNDSARMALVGR